MTDSGDVKDEIRTCLVFPPQWLPVNPHISICSMPGYLRSKGLPVKVIDLNVIFYRTIFTQRHLQYSIDKVLNAYDYLQTRIRLGMTRFGQTSDSAYEVDYYSQIENKIIGKVDHWQEIGSKIEKTISIFDDHENFYDPYKLINALVLMDKALELVSLPYYPTKLTLDNYITPQCPLTLEHLLVFTKNRKQNLFMPFLMGHFAKMLKENVDVYGISINSPAQVIPGLTLARLLRENSGKKFHVNIGGSYFTGLKSVLLEKPEFFKTFADSVSIGQWENSFLHLTRYLKGEISPDKVPGLLYLDPDSRKTIFTFDSEPDETDLHDLAGLELDRYFAPEVIIPTTPHDDAVIDEVVERWKLLSQKHGISNFTFEKPLSPGYIERLSKRVLEENLNVNWFFKARPEEGFTDSRLEQCYKAGLKMISWEMESGSERFFEVMKREIDFQERIEVLKSSAESGIWNSLTLLCGFPGETEVDSTNTLDLLLNNKDIIHSYVKKVFSVSKNSGSAETAKELGLVSNAEDREEFNSALRLENQVNSGMLCDEILEASEKCRKLYKEALDEPLWMYLRFNELIYLYIKKLGIDHVKNFRFSDTEKTDIKSRFADSVNADNLMDSLSYDGILK
jgi:anaerobic magnesium-protoporphyrin IX monomethyl ester cyclase